MGKLRINSQSSIKHALLTLSAAHLLPTAWVKGAESNNALTTKGSLPFPRKSDSYVCFWASLNLLPVEWRAWVPLTLASRQGLPPSAPLEKKQQEEAGTCILPVVEACIACQPPAADPLLSAGEPGIRGLPGAVGEPGAKGAMGKCPTKTGDRFELDILPGALSSFLGISHCSGMSMPLPSWLPPVR